MSLYSEKQDKEVLETLKRIARSLEKIEQHMCAAKVNVAVCPECKKQHVLTQGELDYLEHYGSINIGCPGCKKIFMVDKREPVVLAKEYLEELDTVQIYSGSIRRI